ncbi:hypothetical protein C1J03_07940 [Sulfitobacter sp. SK012]|uniref:sulfotransferase family protein n=1 Tax=Sulfitobacter sp. SK012 TaxID=1389005 RepID=UPI000E0A77DD|nr:sulfotransferase [Sulfitobacter sp. SK012]AXI45959.1 hypothetical protein C1J03_07940 [Sulfitobacter sp. SK012]
MNSSYASPESFVFIVTYGRSGSTLLQNLLNSLPDYEIRGENQNTCLQLAQAWGAIRNSEQITNRRQSGIVSAPTSPWYGAENIDAVAYGAALAEAFVKTVLCPSPGVRVSGFKEIRYHNHPKLFSLHLNFLKVCFPNAKFIFNTRNHKDVARSGWWRNLESEKVEETLQKAERLFAGFIKANPRQCHAVHYDKYIADPSMLKGLFRFLREPYDPALVTRILAQRLDHLKE